MTDAPEPPAADAPEPPGEDAALPPWESGLPDTPPPAQRHDAFDELR